MDGEVVSDVPGVQVCITLHLVHEYRCGYSSEVADETGVEAIEKRIIA